MPGMEGMEGCYPLVLKRIDSSFPPPFVSPSPPPPIPSPLLGSFPLSLSTSRKGR